MVRWSRSTRVLVPLVALVAAVAVLAAPVLGAADLKGRTGELSSARCYGHHREEGFRSMDLFPVSVSQVAKGEPFHFRLTIVNPWLHDLLNPVAFVNISGIPGAKFPGEHPPVEKKASGTLSPAELAAPGAPGGLPGAPAPLGPSRESHTFDVAANATEVFAALAGAPGQFGGNEWTLTLKSPSGKVFAPAKGARVGATSTVRVPYANLSAAGLGAWTATATFARGSDRQAAYDLAVTTFYNLSKSTELYVKGPPKVPKHEKFAVEFEIIAPASTLAGARLVYGGIGTAYHQHTDPNAEDNGNYTKWGTIDFAVGDSTVIGTESVRLLAPDPGPLMRQWGQVLGFAGSFLLLPALFLGGTFGTGSVRLFNRVMGSPRRRVLWHNSTSYLLLTVAVLHMFLFLFEKFWSWSVGLIWGGLSLAAMIGLAFTGAFQKRYVAKWGFERWRFAHFSMGVLVVGFVLVHLLVDGSHLGPIRAWFGGKIG